LKEFLTFLFPFPRFVDPVVYTHPYGHCLPSTLECFTVVGSFLSLRYGEIFGGREGEVRERFLMQSRLKKVRRDWLQVGGAFKGQGKERKTTWIVRRGGGWGYHVYSLLSP